MNREDIEEKGKVNMEEEQQNDKRGKYLFPLITLTTLFFMWGFITCLNDILVPYLKEVFALNHFQSNLVQLAFFVSYFFVSLFYFIISATIGDPIVKIGYKNMILLGLIISAIACFFLFMEARSDNPTFVFFLFSLSLLGMGFTFLQISANPLVASLGTPNTSSSRLNLVQGFNALGTTLAPIIGGYVIFNLLADQVIEGQTRTPEAVQIPYLFLSSVLLILTGVLFFAEIPNVIPEKSRRMSRLGALKHPRLVFGMIGIFCYVGAEVTIGSNLVNYMRDYYSFPDQVASAFLSFYWGGAMIGRFVGAISMSRTNGKRKYISMAVMSVLSLVLIFWAFSKSLDLDVKSMLVFLKERHFWYFIVALVINYVAFISAKSSPSRTLGIFAVLNIVLLSVMLLTQGSLALWAVLSVGLFNSIMFSNVFTLAINGLGKYTSQGSSLLVMMILGGALVPPLQGLLADFLIRLQLPSYYAFALPIICYAYLVWYGFFGCVRGRNRRHGRYNTQFARQYAKGSVGVEKGSTQKKETTSRESMVPKA